MTPQNEFSIFDEIAPSFSVAASHIHKQTIEAIELMDSLSCYLTCKNLYSDEVMKGLFLLKQNEIFFYETDASTFPEAVLNVSYAHLYFNVKGRDDSKHRIVITKNKFSYELTFPEKSKFEAWMKQLKKFCIFTDFEQKYEVVQNSGKGKYLNVESKMGGNHYTAKVFNKSNLLNSSLRNSLIDEIITMRTLDYHRVLKLNEVYETEDSIYLITEFIHDKTLENLFKKSKWQTSAPKPETKSIMFSLLKTLAYVASHGIMHRNIKPANILIEDSSNTKLINFGLAAFLNSSQVTFRTCGTPGYIAPEIFACEQKQDNQIYNNKCDVFSAGCIFFQMLFGYPLFGSSDVAEILETNKNQNINEFINKELKKVKNHPNEQGLNLLFKLLESDPKKRISAEQALIHPYFEIFHCSNEKATQPSELENLVDKTHLEKLLLLSPRSESRKSFATTSECGSSRERSLEKTSLDLNSLHLETALGISPIHKYSKISTHHASIRNHKNHSWNPSPKNERPCQSFLKAAIFCNMKNQVRNASELDIKIPNSSKLNKRSCSESMIPKVEYNSPEFDHNDDANSDDICDEGLDEIRTNYQSFTNNLSNKSRGNSKQSPRIIT